MSTPTVSEVLFETLCAQRSVPCSRIAEGTDKTADYRLVLGSTAVVAEVKQLDENDADKRLAPVWGYPRVAWYHSSI